MVVEIFIAEPDSKTRCDTNSCTTIAYERDYCYSGMNASTLADRIGPHETDQVERRAERRREWPVRLETRAVALGGSRYPLELDSIILAGERCRSPL